MTDDYLNLEGEALLPPGHSSYIRRGLYNSDWVVGPPTPTGNIDNNTNPLPYWFWYPLDSSVSLKYLVPTVTLAPRLQFVASSVTPVGDAGYIQQWYRGTLADSYQVKVVAGWTGNAVLYVELRYLRVDDTIISTTRANVPSDSTVSLPLMVTPSGAASMYVRLGMNLTAAGVTSTATVTALSLQEPSGAMKYVPLATLVDAVTAGSTTVASLAQAISNEMTTLPIGVTAVTGYIQMRTSGATIGTNVYARAEHYGGGTGTIAYPQVNNVYLAASFTCATGGTNGRQIKYSIGWVDGTITYYIRVTGYYIPA